MHICIGNNTPKAPNPMGCIYDLGISNPYNRLLYSMLCIAGLQLTSRQPCWGTTTKRFPPLGTKLFYHANSAKKFFIVLTTNMAALSRGCKRSICVKNDPLVFNYILFAPQMLEICIRFYTRIRKFLCRF